MLVNCKATECQFYDGGCTQNMIDIDAYGECRTGNWVDEDDLDGDLEDDFEDLMKAGG